MEKTTASAGDGVKRNRLRTGSVHEDSPRKKTISANNKLVINVATEKMTRTKEVQHEYLKRRLRTAIEILPEDRLRKPYPGLP